MDDESYMTEALHLAGHGRGWVEPNPMVGAVVVRGGQVIGRGWHRRCGGWHAEVEALHDCRGHGHDPAGATVYVTLEPCSHHGRTPPCTDALISAGVGRVVVAMVDPSEHAAGAGLRRLREAGIEVKVGVCEQAAKELNAPFVKQVTAGLPWVTLKWAQTLDGRIATGTGDSRWISGEASRQRVHQWRATADAIMVGIGTVLADDPQLTARGVEVARLALRVVVDPDLRMPSDARMVEPLSPEHPPVILAVDETLVKADDPRVIEWKSRGATVVGLPHWEKAGQASDDPHGRLDLESLMRELACVHNATNVLVEGGASLHGSLLGQGLVDQVLAFVAPLLMGDDKALPAVRGLGCATVAEAATLSLRGVERIGDDVLLDYRMR